MQHDCTQIYVQSPHRELWTPQLLKLNSQYSLCLLICVFCLCSIKLIIVCLHGNTILLLHLGYCISLAWQLTKSSHLLDICLCHNTNSWDSTDIVYIHCQSVWIHLDLFSPLMQAVIFPAPVICGRQYLGLGLVIGWWRLMKLLYFFFWWTAKECFRTFRIF